MTIVSREAMQKALDTGDMRRLHRLAGEAIVSLGDRSSTDVHHAVSKILAKHGFPPPPKSASSIKTKLIDAATTLDEFMLSYQMENSSNNRQRIIEIVVKEIINTRHIEDAVPGSPEAKRLAKMPMHTRVFVNLSNLERIVFNMNRAFPGYLQSGILNLVGIKYSTNDPRNAPGITADYHYPSEVIEHDDNPETEANRQELKEATAEVKRKERIRNIKPAPPGYEPQPLCPGLDADGALLPPDD